jgi:hypothetical protein
MRLIRTIICLLIFSTPASTLLAEQIEIIAGAGPSTQIVKLFFKQLPKHKNVADYRFIVPGKSAKHQGGIINADNFLFGRTGRPIAQFEHTLGKREIILGQVPIAFVAGNGVPRLRFTMEDIRKIFMREVDNWKAFGGSDVPIELIGRERRESFFLALKVKYPFFKQVVFDRVFHKDDGVMQFLASSAGKYAISFGAACNFPKTNQVDVTNFSIGIKVGLVYDFVNDAHPIVLAAKEFTASDDWKRLVHDAGMLPID